MIQGAIQADMLSKTQVNSRTTRLHLLLPTYILVHIYRTGLRVQVLLIPLLLVLGFVSHLVRELVRHVPLVAEEVDEHAVSRMRRRRARRLRAQHVVCLYHRGLVSSIEV